MYPHSGPKGELCGIRFTHQKHGSLTSFKYLLGVKMPLRTDYIASRYDVISVPPNQNPGEMNRTSSAKAL